MTRERWKEVEAVFEQALERPAEERAAFVQTSCNGDEELRREVESLLESHTSAGDFIDERSRFFSEEDFKDADEAVPPGELIGAYRVICEIGRGGMGAVYLAERADRQYRKRVAIKLIKRGMDTDSVLRQFRKEQQILASLDHPNIAALYDAGTTTTGLPYFVMEYVQGVPIDAYCDAHSLSITERLKLFRQVCTALTYAHEYTVIHRDIKPSNIFVTADGVPKLLDFGIAKVLQPAEGFETLMTAAGARPMTPEYASPEQIRGEPVTTGSDIYALGVVLYELLTGTSPYRLTSRTPRNVEHAITDEEPTRPSTVISEQKNPDSAIRNPKLLRGDLDNILLMALRKDPARRYQSVEQFSEDIGRHLEGLPVQARRDTLIYRGGKFIRRNSTLVAASTACFLLALVVAWLLRQQFLVSWKASAPEKSIAVLPFENLSKDQENAFFADGVQDEILTSLSKVADLKVISRTSVMGYKDAAKRDLREIGQQLGVANVLEGSVQRTANRVRVNAQLINARTDAHLWAQTYDGDLADVFAIQSQIAQAIAEQLQAQLSSREKAAIAHPPTTDVAANAPYQEALRVEHEPPEDQNLRRAIRLLEQAVARDPKFALAYCAMSSAHMSLYFAGYDHTPARREQAKAALEKAAQLQPDAGEVHLAAAEYWFHGFYDYDQARTELELARRKLPNNSKVYFMTAVMDRHQGRWSEAVGNFERTIELDPRDEGALMNAGSIYEDLHRYSDATRMYERAATVSPSDYLPRILARYQPLSERADIHPLRAELDAIVAADPIVATKIADHLWFCARMERDRGAIERALAAIPREGITVGSNIVRPREWFVGYAARLFGDAKTASTAFTTARAILEKTVQEQPNRAEGWALLGRVDAALGRKEDAIREGRRACELLPISKDTSSGFGRLRDLAQIYTWTEEKELALAQLDALTTKIPSLDYGDLKLDPDWDSLRDDPRFEKLVRRLAPPPAAAVAAIPEKSIAVLPFQNLSDDKDSAYFADGIQEEILTRLRCFPTTRPRTTGWVTFLRKEEWRRRQ